MQVSVVITSYNRFDLLKHTVESFNAVNTYPIEKFIIIEDSASQQMYEAIENLISSRQDPLVKQYHFIFNEKNMGQVESIDIAYSRVETPYVFHSEDDYDFYRPGFIENSLKVLEAKRDIMQVWIRRMDDTTGHPIINDVHYADGQPYYVLGSHQEWYGFCFQCGLRKMSAYERIKPFAQWSPKTDFPAQRECKIGIAYHKLGYKAAILPEGYARHTGFGRSVSGNMNL